MVRFNRIALQTCQLPVDHDVEMPEIDLSEDRRSLHEWLLKVHDHPANKTAATWARSQIQISPSRFQFLLEVTAEVSRFALPTWLGKAFNPSLNPVAVGTFPQETRDVDFLEDIIMKIWHGMHTGCLQALKFIFQEATPGILAQHRLSLR